MSHHQPQKIGVIGIFRYLDDILAAIDEIKLRNDFVGHEVYAPTSYHELMEQAEDIYGPSEVRWFTLVGALMGVTTGFGMPLLLDYDWPLVVGGKSAVFYSLPAYFIFGFELMILFGAIATILGMLVMGRLPNPNARIHDARITDDCFAIYIPQVQPDSEQAKLLKKWGAEEIRSSTK